MVGRVYKIQKPIRPKKRGNEQIAELGSRLNVLNEFRWDTHWPKSRFHEDFRPTLEQFSTFWKVGLPHDPGKFTKALFRHPNLRSPGVLLTTSDRKSGALAVRCLAFFRR